jgi:hypothetical protein
VAESNCCREGQLSRLSLYLDFTFALKPVVGFLHQDTDLSGFVVFKDNCQGALANRVTTRTQNRLSKKLKLYPV